MTTNQQKAERQRKGGRKLTGTKLYVGSDGFYRARVWRVIDGVKVRPVINFETTSKLAAAAKLRIELAKDAPEFEALAEPETFAEAAKRIVELQGDEGMRTWRERWHRIEKYVLPELGPLDVRKITTALVREVLATAGKTLSKQSVSHLRTDMSTVFQQLWSDDVIPLNPLQKGKLKLPKNLKVDGRPRLILNDDEFDQLLSYALQSEGRRTLGLMCLASRAFGGQRTSDLHAWDWHHIDTKTWTAAKVYRPKTEQNDDGTPAHESELTAFEMSAVLLGPLKSYWTSKGKPKAGPVFPIAIGENAGERHGKRSYVRELRAALWEAGVRRPMADTPEAREALRLALERAAEAGKARAGVPGRWSVPAVRAAREAVQLAQAAAKKHCALQTDTPQYRRVDFHSFRRAYVTAAYASGATVPDAMALAGHTDPRTSAKYHMLSQRGAVAQPAGMLPRLSEAKDSAVSFQPPANLVTTGDPDENRTRVIGVRGRRPNR